MKHLKSMDEPAAATSGLGASVWLTLTRLTGTRPIVTLIIVTVLLTATGCSTAESAPGTPPPLTVAVAEVQQRDVPIYSEWIGTLDGFVNADIKAQVSGYRVRQEYTEGTFVRSGQLLFQIDPRPFQAALEQAEGQLARSQGDLFQAQLDLARVRLQELLTVVQVYKALGGGWQ